MIDKEVYDRLKERFGPYASWAIWHQPEEGKPASNTGTNGLFSNESVLEVLQTKYVIVGLNISRDQGNPEPWGNFHSIGNKQRDFKLRYALWGTSCWGSYMTDILKDFEEKNSNNVMRADRADPSLGKKSFDLFKEELSIIKDPTVLIVLGSAAKKVLEQMEKDFNFIFPDKIYVPHYSMWCSKEVYRRKLLDKLKLVGVSECMGFSSGN